MRHWSAALAAALVLALSPARAHGADKVPIDAFTTTDNVEAPRISPNGTYLAVTANLGNETHAIVVYRIDGMRQTALLKLPRFELPVQTRWVSDTRLVIAKGRLVGTREKPVPTGDIIATDYDGRNQKYVFGWDVKVSGMDRGIGFIAGVPRVPNGHFYMRHYAPNSKRSMLYDMDAQRGTHALVADIGQEDMTFVLDPAGVPRFAWGDPDYDTYLLFEADAQGRRWTPAAASRPGTRFEPFAISADGNGVFAFLSANGGPVSLLRTDFQGNDRRVLASDPLNSVADVEWDAANQPFAATVGGGRPRTLYFDPESVDALEHRKLSGLFPDHHVTYVNHTADGNTTLLYAYSDRDPGMWYLFDRARASVKPLLATLPRIDPTRMGERRHVRFQASDGLELDGYLTLPAGTAEPAALPMVLVPHGGPHGVSDRWAYNRDAQFLASRGYLVLQVNYRGSEGRGGSFERAGYRQWGGHVQEDLLDGVRWSIAQGYADPKRICAYGGSFGAYSAMMVAVRAPELIRCAAGVAGLYDLEAFANDSDTSSTRYGRSYIERVIGHDRAEWQANSPVALAARIQVPVLLAHGEVDERTPYAQAVAMRKALVAAGNPPEWLSVPGEGHGFYKDANKVAFYRQLEAFMAKHLGAGAPPPAAE